MIFCVAHNENIWDVNATIYLSPGMDATHTTPALRYTALPGPALEYESALLVGI